jgi:hypothetical protein
MGRGSMNRSKYGQIALGVTAVISLIIAGVAVSQLQQNGTPIFSRTEYDVSSYPYYYWTSFVVEGHPNVDAYLRVQFRCQGLSSIESAWFSYMLFAGNSSVLYVYHDPDNSTLRWEMEEHGLFLRFSSSTNLAFQTSSDEILDFIIEPGEYAWVHFLESSDHITAVSVSVTVSIVYK